MSKFSTQIYSLLKQVPKGKVTTYKALAEALNSTAYRAVGGAMKNNPYAPEVPCHRVVSSDGSIGGFRGSRSGKDIQDKIKMLEKEGIKIKNHRIVNFDQVFFQPIKQSAQPFAQL